MFFSFYTEIQDGRQKLRENDFWKKVAEDPVNTLWIKKFIEITLSCTISEINTFLPFTQKFKMAAKNGGKNKFWETIAEDSVYTLGVKNFVEIALSRTISKINMFLYFMQKFKIAIKNGGKTSFDKMKGKDF